MRCAWSSTAHAQHMHGHASRLTGESRSAADLQLHREHRWAAQVSKPTSWLPATHSSSDPALSAAPAEPGQKVCAPCWGIKGVVAIKLCIMRYLRKHSASKLKQTTLKLLLLLVPAWCSRLSSTCTDGALCSLLSY